MSRILTCYYRPKPGGFCKRLFRAIEALLADGHEVHYLAVVPFPISHPNCHFHRFPWPQNKTDILLFWGFFHTLAPLLLLFHGFRQRVTHLFAFGSNYGLLLQLLRITKHIPLALFLRGDPIMHHQLKGRHRWIIFADKFLEGMSLYGTHMYGVSHTLSQRIMKRHTILKPAAAGTLPNEVLHIKRRPQRTPVPPLALACVGTFEQEKNHTLIIRCMAHLPPQQAHLYLYGAGSGENLLRGLVKELDIADRVTFMGWIEPAGEIWENTDLLLFPSRYEGSPNSVLEALAYRIPVIASDIPEHREILPESNLINTLDLSSWVKQMKKVAENPKNMLAAICSRQSAKLNTLSFDWDAHIRSIILCQTTKKVTANDAPISKGDKS